MYVFHNDTYIQNQKIKKLKETLHLVVFDFLQVL